MVCCLSLMFSIALNNNQHNFFCKTFYFSIKCFITHFFADIDTDELDSDTKNVEEEIVEFFIKEEITVID